jgi:hypothetical protein
MQFVPIPKEHLDNMWQYVEPIIIKAVGLTPDRIDTKNILADAKEGRYLIWIVTEQRKDTQYIQAVLTTRISQYPKTNALCVDFVAGTRMKDWLPIVMPVFEELGKTNKCSHIEGYGRKAWAKYLNKYGWQQQHIQYEKRLDNE